MREKIARKRPENNAWFKTVLENNFGLSPGDTQDQRSELIERYRKAIMDGNQVEAQRVIEQGVEAGVPVFRSIC